MADRREPSHPPSDPHPGLARANSLLAGEDRPVRAQLIAALLLGLVLVASGLYLWRRPHADGESASSEPASSSSSEPAPVISDAGLLAAVPEAGASGPVSLSDVRTLACQDRGAKKTAPDQCDRLTPVEQALSSAIHQAAACVPGTAGGGTIEYVADVSFSRHRVNSSFRAPDARCTTARPSAHARPRCAARSRAWPWRGWNTSTRATRSP